MDQEISLEKHKDIVLNPWILFLPYLPVIVIALAVGIDAATGYGLAGRLPSSPYQVFLYSLIFGNPHVIASTLILLDKEYIRFYGRKIFIRAVFVSIIVAAILHYLGMNAFYAFFYSWTILHVNKQQLGIGKMLNRQYSKQYDYWSWLFVAVSIFIAIGVGYFRVNTHVPFQFIHDFVVLGGTLTLLLGLLIVLRIKKDIGKYYLLSNLALLAVTMVCYLRGFTLFAILMSRFAHDITAYIFYVTHDINRNTPKPKQYIYKLTGNRVPIWIVCMVMSIGLAALLLVNQSVLLFNIAVALNSFHYITEALTWKRDSLHRKHLSFDLN